MQCRQGRGSIPRVGIFILLSRCIFLHFFSIFLHSKTTRHTTPDESRLIAHISQLLRSAKRPARIFEGAARPVNRFVPLCLAHSLSCACYLDATCSPLHPPDFKIVNHRLLPTFRSQSGERTRFPRTAEPQHGVSVCTA